MMNMRTMGTQSVAEILDGLKQNAVQAVKRLLMDRRMEAISVNGTVRLSWMDKKGRSYNGGITKVSLDGERLYIQVQNNSLSSYLLDERQFMPGCHIWLAKLKEVIIHAQTADRQTA